MPEQKFDPVKEFISLRDNISKSVNKGLRGVTGVLAFPAVDIYEDENAVVVYTEPLLGIDKSSIEVSMEQDRLSISGVTKSPFNVADTAYLHRELHFGKFKRDIQIPRRVKANEAKASVKNNVLTVTLPKQTAAAQDQIIDVTPAE